MNHQHKTLPKEPTKEICELGKGIDWLMQSTAILPRDLYAKSRDPQNPPHANHPLRRLLVDRSPVPLRELRLIVEMLGHL
jgi:hypothetical protein